jgi:hypothetical protein
MFNYGMKISVYSEKRAHKEDGVGWTRECDNILYYPNAIRRKHGDFASHYYSLTFTYTFKHDQDCVYFAYSVPYSFSDLRNDLNEIELNEERSIFM